MKWKPLLQHLFPGERLTSHQPVSGGCINYCYKIITDKQSYFVKFNTAARFPRMYACEAFSLKVLKETGLVHVPNVLQYGDVEDMTFLVLEYIEPKPASTKALEKLGHDLAMLHKTATAEQFGWDHNNYIGSLMQDNTRCGDWHEFYETRRILPLCNALVETGVLDYATLQQCKQYLSSHRDLVPNEKPTLLHGDLWSGNFLIGQNETPYVIDPACYYGHREMDIALTQLFGGFGNEFLAAYREVYPLQQGWQKRLTFFQLYPLLVHAVIFGGGYIDKVRNIFHQAIR